MGTGQGQVKIKPLEKKYYLPKKKAGYQVTIKLPLRPITGQYGRPLSMVELIPGRKKKGRIKIERLIIGISGLEKEGYTSFRTVDCNTAALELGNHTQWNLMQICPEHRALYVEFYPPRTGAKFLIIRNLWSDISSSIDWE